MRVRERRDLILAAAADLFREKGFHAVGIDEIGTAAGISGPGVYRHFDGKDGLLVAVLREATEELWRTPEGDVELVDYVRRHVEFAVAHGDTIDLWHREGRNLPKEAQDAQREVVETYVGQWAGRLRAERPDLSPAEARVRVRATLGLIHSMTHPDMAGAPASVVERMALAALLAQ